MAITAVGTMFGTGYSTGTTTTTDSPATVGNVIVLRAVTGSGGITSTGVSGGNCTWQAGTSSWTDQDGETHRIWLGTATATGSSTITVAFSGSVSSTSVAIYCQEFTAGLGASTVWAVDTSDTHNTASGATTTYPSLTAAGIGEVYVGYQFSNVGNASAGSTSGFVYQIGSDATALIYNLSYTSLTTPTSPLSPNSTSSAIAVLLTASLTTVTFAVTATSTLAIASPPTVYPLTGNVLSNPTTNALAGQVCNAYLSSRFGSPTTTPAVNSAAPGGGADAGPYTTPSLGGGFAFGVLALANYMVSYYDPTDFTNAGTFNLYWLGPLASGWNVVYGLGAVALGGGAAPTLGTIGGPGPANAAQAKWVAIQINGVTYWMPVWQ